MIELTANVEVGGIKFDGFNLCAANPHLFIDASDDGTQITADKARAKNVEIGSLVAPIWASTGGGPVEERKQFDLQVRKTYDSVKELLADAEIDAVFIFTNMETHCEYTIQAAQAGKHVLVEKPAASNCTELKEMQAAIQKAGVQCMPVHNYIYEPGIERTKSMIEDGKLGDIVQFYMMYNIHHTDEIRARYPGVIRQILTHHSYTMLYLAGEPKTVSCFKNTVDDRIAPQENVAMANIQMQNGTLSHLCASFANDDHAGDPWTCIIKVIGTKGSTRYSYRDFVINDRNGAHSQTYQNYPESIKNTAKHFIDRVVRLGEKPLSSLQDTITCQQIIEACELSVEKGIHVTLKK